MAQTFNPRSRRTKNFWEPIFEPKLTENFDEGDWSKVRGEGATQKTLTAEAMKKFSSTGSTLKFENITFIKCDFFGFFNELRRAVIFNGCDFERCDFGLSTWDRAKFSYCSFKQTSLTQSTWIDCEFRDCEWQDIGLSGNETRIPGTFISNPGSIVASAYFQDDIKILAKAGRTLERQKARFYETRSVFSRQIYNEHKAVGDEDSFYESAKVFSRASIRNRIYAQLHPRENKDGTRPNRRWFKVAGLYGEFALTNTLGWMNRWGESVFRPFLMAILVMLVFAVLYWAFELSPLQALGRSYEIATIAGYSKGTYASSGIREYLEFIQITLALILYTVFFSTIVAKICRVR